MSAENRKECLNLVAEARASGARSVKACDLLGVSVRTAERWATQPEDLRQGPKTKPAQSFTDAERHQILAVANSPEFANLPPCQIVPMLADRGEYIGSESSVYRILRSEKMLTHRSRSWPRKHRKPEALVATRPHQIWIWDITYLRSAIKGTFYYL